MSRADILRAYYDVPRGKLVQPPPGQRLFEIWAEGFVITGQSAGASLMGSAHGASFEEACENLAKADPEFARYFDRAHLSFWGCRLYDNAADARKFNG